MVKIASCSATKYLLEKITHPELKKYIVDLYVEKFSDGEMAVQYKESIRGRDLYLFGDTSQNLTELLLAIDGAKRSSCASLTVILPYYGYGRQDKKDGHRGSLGAAVMARALEAAGVDRIVSIDLHADQIQGMFQIPLEHIKGHSIFMNYIENNIDLSNMILCSPDSGGTHRVEKYSKKLNLSMVSMNKSRDKPNSVESMELIGSVDGKDVIIIDDMVDTCGTLKKAVEYLKEKGALKIYYVATHPVLSGMAYENLTESQLEKIIISDTIKKYTHQNVEQQVNIESNPHLQNLIVELSCISVLEKVINNLIIDESISKINEI
jgi:ribose-phosphate pyrophosphokinase